MILEDNLLEIANRANLKVTQSETTVSIQQQLRFRDKSIFGVVLFFLFGILLIVLTMIKKMDATSGYVMIAIGVFIMVLSVLTLIRQAIDFVSITDNHILVRHNLRYSSFPITSASKIEIRTEKMDVRRSTFYNVSLYLPMDGKELRILTFNMDYTEAEKATKLGRAIKNMLNDKINYYQDGHQ